MKERSKSLTPMLGRNMILMIKIPSQISKVETTSDKCLKLTIHTTQELVPSDKAEVFKLKQKIGWMVFSDVNIEESDVLSFFSDGTPVADDIAEMRVRWKVNQSKIFLIKLEPPLRRLFAL